MSRDIFDLFFDSNFGYFNGDVGFTRRYSEIKEDGKTVLLFNAVGMTKDDIQVQVKRSGKDQYLEIEGSSSHEYVKNEFKQRFEIRDGDIKEIKPSVKSGLLSVEVIYNIPKHKEIPVKW
jgi:HSP20 family molecular chaperone IbpA